MAFSNLLQDMIQPWLKIFTYDTTIDNNFYLRSGIGMPMGYVLTLTDPTKGQGTWQPASGGGGGGVSSLEVPLGNTTLLITPGSTGALSISATGNFGNANVTTLNLTANGSAISLGTVPESTAIVLNGASTDIQTGSLTVHGSTISTFEDQVILNSTSGLQIAYGTPTNNYVLTSDASGNASWARPLVEQVEGDGETIVVNSLGAGVYQIVATGVFPANVSASGVVSAINGFSSVSTTAALNLTNAAGSSFFRYKTANSTSNGMVLALTNATTGACDWTAAPAAGVSSIVQTAGLSPNGTLSVSNPGIGNVTLECTGNFLNLGTSKVSAYTIQCGDPSAGLGAFFLTNNLASNGFVLTCTNTLTGQGQWRSLNTQAVQSLNNADASIALTGIGSGPYTGAATIRATGTFSSNVTCPNLTSPGNIVSTGGIVQGSTLVSTGQLNVQTVITQGGLTPTSSNQISLPTTFVSSAPVTIQSSSIFNYGSGASAPAVNKVLTCTDTSGTAVWSTLTSGGVSSIANGDSSLSIIGTGGPMYTGAITLNSTGKFNTQAVVCGNGLNVGNNPAVFQGTCPVQFEAPVLRTFNENYTLLTFIAGDLPPLVLQPQQLFGFIECNLPNGAIGSNNKMTLVIPAASAIISYLNDIGVATPNGGSLSWDLTIAITAGGAVSIPTRVGPQVQLNQSSDLSVIFAGYNGTWPLGDNVNPQFINGPANSGNVSRRTFTFIATWGAIVPIFVYY